MNCICKLEFVLKYIFFKEGTLEWKRTSRDVIDCSRTWDVYMGGEASIWFHIQYHFYIYITCKTLKLL